MHPERPTAPVRVPPTDEWAIREDGGRWYILPPLGLPELGPFASEAIARRQLVLLRTRAGDPWY